MSGLFQTDTPFHIFQDKYKPKEKATTKCSDLP